MNKNNNLNIRNREGFIKDIESKSDKDIIIKVVIKPEYK